MDPQITSQLTSIAIAAGIAGLTWLYHKAKGDKQQSVTELLDGLVANALHVAVVTAGSRVDDLVGVVEAAAWKGLLAAKVPRNDTTVLLVHAAVQTGVADAIAEVKAHDRAVELAIAANVAAAQAEVAKPAPKPPAIPNIAANMTIVELGPNDPMPAVETSK
jgi:hypothetical protein